MKTGINPVKTILTNKKHFILKMLFLYSVVTKNVIARLTHIYQSKLK